MATTTASATLRRPQLSTVLWRPLGSLATVAVLIAIGLALTAKLPHPSPLMIVAVLVIIAATVWFLISERYEWTLAVLMLYIGLADGYLKLRTGSSSVTLVRDLLLYAIVFGALLRAAVRHQPLELPPLGGWVVAWTLVVVVQIANPHNGTLTHSIASLRPQLEWVPLFFLGFLVMRSKARLRAFLVLLVVIGALNGVVGLVQLNMSPAQLSAWGPGYAKAIDGESTVSPRGFVDENGTDKNRPFALGGDIGFGGTVGFFAIAAAVALLTIVGPLWRIPIGILAAGVVVAIITSEARTVIVCSIVTLLAYGGLSITSRLGPKALFTVVGGFLAGVAVVSVLVANTESGSFSRYNTISSPTEAVSTAYSYRSGVIANVPKYAVEIPFGGGFGSKGPAGSFGGGKANKLNAESEPTFLLIEVGVIGLLVMVAFNLRLLYLSVARIRWIPDREARIMLTAIAAPLFALFASGFAGICTATVPGGPYLWLAAGIFSYWLYGERATR
jgi:hypothetical protein